MEITTIIVLMCVAGGLIGFIIGIIGYSMKPKKISIILLGVSVLILIISNIFLYKTVLSKPEEIKENIKTINDHSSNNKKEQVVASEKKDDTYKGLEKIREDRNKAMKEAKGN